MPQTRIKWSGILRGFNEGWGTVMRYAYVMSWHNALVDTGSIPDNGTQTSRMAALGVQVKLAIISPSGRRRCVLCLVLYGEHLRVYNRMAATGLHRLCSRSVAQLQAAKTLRELTSRVPMHSPPTSINTVYGGATLDCHEDHPSY